MHVLRHREYRLSDNNISYSARPVLRLYVRNPFMRLYSRSREKSVCALCQRIPFGKLFVHTPGARFVYSVGQYGIDICESGRPITSCAFCFLIQSSLAKLDELPRRSRLSVKLSTPWYKRMLQVVQHNMSYYRECSLFIAMASVEPGLVELKVMDYYEWQELKNAGQWDSQSCSRKFLIQNVADDVQPHPEMEDSLGTKSTVDFDLIQRWIETCCKQHGICGRHAWGSPKEESWPKRLIDVRECRIVEASQNTDYLALSYVWGTDVSLKLTTENVEEISQEGALENPQYKLPRTVLDAMTACRKCRQRYLWVDLLCIVQNDEKDKQEEIRKMDKIYGSAVATIIAADGRDMNYGLRGVTPGTRDIMFDPRLCSEAFVREVNPTMKLRAPLQRTRRSDSLPNFSRDHNHHNHVPSVGGLRPATLGTFEEEPVPLLGNTIWSSRAWTFQEWLLSKRLLIFQNDRVFWYCKQRLWCEKFTQNIDSLEFCVDQKYQLTNRFQLEPSYFLSKPQAGQQDGSVEVRKDGTTVIVRSGKFAAYGWAVHAYTQRYLSNHRDIQNAFKGISKVLEPCFGTGMLYCLPESHLDAALLWRPVTCLHRRNVGDFPSWSWTGWVGQVSYEDPYGIGEGGKRSELYWGESGEERLRCFIRWHKYSPESNTFTPINSHGYGISSIPNIQIPTSNLGGDPPRGWDQLLAAPDILAPPFDPIIASRSLLLNTLYAKLRVRRNRLQGYGHAFDVLNDVGDWIGNGVFDGDTVPNCSHSMIVISQAQFFWTPKEVRNRGLYKTPAEHKLYNVLLVKQDTKRETVQRIGSARVCKEEFHRLSSGEKDFYLV